MTLWYRQPAGKWLEALVQKPCGRNQLAAGIARWLG
jgi:hypothetical protein